MMTDPSGMMGGMGGMMAWGMGLIWLLVFLLLILGVAALVKYLFFESRRRHDDG